MPLDVQEELARLREENHSLSVRLESHPSRAQIAGMEGLVSDLQAQLHAAHAARRSSSPQRHRSAEDVRAVKVCPSSYWQGMKCLPLLRLRNSMTRDPSCSLRCTTRDARHGTCGQHSRQLPTQRRCREPLLRPKRLFRSKPAL